MDYTDLKFRCGLEIHRQLDTNKLFCNCPSTLKETKPDKIVIRKLHPVKGETEETDVAAEYESTKDKTFLYYFYTDCNCLIDLDEEPPLQLNIEALKIVLEVATILQCKIVDEIQIMRKTIVDGSNTSAFQRTALIAFSGYIDTSKGHIKIESICLEEDSARKIKEDKKETHYNLDRLGIPLIEIATDSSIKDPDHAKEVAEKLGMILKSTGKVRQGIGTIRQDVNISINNGSRVEIKGFQDLKLMPKTIENEVKRQLKEKTNPEVRQALPDGTSTFLRPMPSASRMYPETDMPSFKITKELLKSIIIPELISTKKYSLEKEYGLDPSLAKEIIKQNINFKEYCNKFQNIKPRDIAIILIETPKDLNSRLKLDAKKLKEKDFLEVLTYLNEEKINKEAVQEILKEKIEKGKVNYEDYKKLNPQELEKDIKQILKENPDAPINALMGLVMKKYRGKVSGKEIINLLQKLK